MQAFNRAKNLTVAIFAATFAVLLTIVVCGFFILQAAGKLADEVHTEDVNRLVTNEINQQIVRLAREQAQVSNWTNTLTAVQEPIDRRFIRNEIVEWLWPDFDIERTTIFNPAGQSIINVLRSRLLSPDTGMEHKAPNLDLIEAAIALYYEKRQRAPGGFTFPHDPLGGEGRIYTSDIRQINGKTVMVVAQAIVPHDETVLPKGPPFVMLTQKPIDDAFLNSRRDALELEKFEVLPAGTSIAENMNAQAIGQSGLFAVWSDGSPSKVIWRNSMPLIGFLVSLLTCTLLLLAVRYNRAMVALKQSEAENRHLALHDGLSGLPNRLHFDRKLEEMVACRTHGSSAIICMDLDRFKAVNDTFGHEVGDIVIKTASDRIQDVVVDRALVARMGGDEFTLIVFDASDREEIRSMCEDIITSISKDISFYGGRARIGASAGVALWDDETASPKEVIRNADAALYRAKVAGRGRVCFSDEPVTTANDSGKDQQSHNTRHAA